MADASVYANYKGSKGIKSGGVWQDGAFTNEDWRPTWRRFNGLVRQAKPMYSNYFSNDEATAMKQMKAFIKANLTGLKRGPDNNYVDNIKNIDELYAILGQASHDLYNLSYKTQDGYDEPHPAFTEPLKRALGEFSNFLDLTNQLEAKGLNTKQINQFLSSNKVQGKDSSTLAELANNIDGFSTSEIANYGVQNDPDDPESYQMTDADVATGSAITPQEQADDAVETTVLGKSSLDDLRNTPGFVEENGKYYLNQLDEDGNPVKDASGNPVRQEFAVDENNNQIVYVGGDKSGDRWSVPGTSKADTVDQMSEDERAAYESIKGLSAEYEKFGRDTLAAIDAPENDFAGQINAQLNQFLNGYTGTDGKPVKGFLDYQSDLEGAGQTLKTDMQGLQQEYDQAYASYEGELDPLRNQMGTITDMSMDVARDANDQNYYTRLKDTLYADAQESINRSASGARDTLNQTYANAGLDPSSPAFTAAMRDLAQSRADSERSANRQAILDSYGLGSQMLTNRSNALTGASNAIGAEMSALDSLYGVKLQGLNNRKDMIGQIYNVDKNNATVGMQGLNTVLDTGLKGISANQTQFNKNIDLTNSIYSNLINAQSGIRNLADQEGRTAEGDLIDFSNAGKSDDFTYGSFELALQQAYPDGNIPDSLKTLLEKYNPNK